MAFILSPLTLKCTIMQRAAANQGLEDLMEAAQHMAMEERMDVDGAHGSPPPGSPMLTGSTIKAAAGDEEEDEQIDEAAAGVEEEGEEEELDSESESASEADGEEEGDGGDGNFVLSDFEPSDFEDESDQDKMAATSEIHKNGCHGGVPMQDHPTEHVFLVVCSDQR